MFKGRTLFIATKHQKESVMAPILENALGVSCMVDIFFDTDQFGTFSGEIERTDDPLTTAKKKCKYAMETYNFDLVVASEGSFGSHPNAFFIPVDEELLVLLDKKNGIEIKIREISTETNFAGQNIKAEKELHDFAIKVGFPSHGLIIKKTQSDTNDAIKGITNEIQLSQTCQKMLQDYGSFWVETDMRAMYNPTRMKVIKKATEKLVEKINSLCPKCDWPGFGVSEVLRGLPCKLCKMPTNSTLAYLFCCENCSYSEKKLFPNQLKYENPKYCDYCNP